LLIPQNVVDEAKLNFGRSAIDIIIKDLNIQGFDERGLKGCCPFHDEQTASFRWSDVNSNFHCFGCGVSYSIVDHYIDFYKMTYIEAIEKLLQEVESDFRIVEKGIKVDRSYNYPDHVENENRSQVEKYMEQRKISKETMDYCDVQSDENSNIVFHYYDENDVLKLVKYRPSRKISKGEPKTWCQKDKDTTNLLFNMNKADPSKPLLITEGECFRGDTEILTRKGWVRLDKYYQYSSAAENRQVLEVDKSLTGHFVEPQAFIKKSIDAKISSYEGVSKKTFGKHILQATPKHNIYTMTPSGTIIKRKMEDLKDLTGVIIPQSVVSSGVGLSYTEPQLSLQLACISSSSKWDNKKSRSYVRYYKHSKRRYNYVLSLLDKLSIGHFEVTDKKITKTPYLGFVAPDFLKEILPMSFATKATLGEKQMIIKKLLEWEYLFSTGARNMEIMLENEVNAEVIDTLIHLTGMNASVSKKGNFTRILVKVTNSTGQVECDYHEYDYRGKVYCVTVPSGMIMIRQNGTIFITGNCDALAVIESGFKNTVSIPLGAGNEQWIETNWDFLEQFEKIIIWSDNDDPGIKMRRHACSRLGAGKTYYIDLPNKIDDIPVKDANEVLFKFGKQKILELIDDVKEYSIKNVVNLAEVADYDIESAEGMTSGFKGLDKHIYKFVMGTLCIITGVSGNGKSVLVNQMCICEPLNQGYDSFIFSGELSHPQLKNWIELVMSGTECIQVKDQHIRKIDKECLNPLRKWYNGRVWVYDNDIDFSAEAILEKMEELARKKGVKVFTIDNLMTVDLSCTTDNIYQKQKEFARKLVNFANKFNVLVFLVAHPKKFEASRRITKLDISGSADLMNLAHYIISVHRYTKEEKEGVKNWDTEKYKKGQEPKDHDVVINLHKNRLTGIQDKEVELWFDNPSYRFFEDTNGLYKRYKWNTDTSPLPKTNPREQRAPDFMMQKGA